MMNNKPEWQIFSKRYNKFTEFRYTSLFSDTQKNRDV